MTTDSYFWNGSFNHGTYASLAASFQTRTNCELIEGGFAEGQADPEAYRRSSPIYFAEGLKAFADKRQPRFTGA